MRIAECCNRCDKKFIRNRRASRDRRDKRGFGLIDAVCLSDRLFGLVYLGSLSGLLIRSALSEGVSARDRPDRLVPALVRVARRSCAVKENGLNERIGSDPLFSPFHRF